MMIYIYIVVDNSKFKSLFNISLQDCSYQDKNTNLLSFKVTKFLIHQ